jgi:hypothetical protein
MDNAYPDYNAEARIQVAPSGLRPRHLTKQRTGLGHRDDSMPYRQHHSLPWAKPPSHDPEVVTYLV